MRDPLNIVHVEYNGEGFQIVKMEDIPPFDIPDYDLFDDKSRQKYFDSIERLCRKSMHYQEFTKYLRENCNMNECSFYENVTNQNTFKIKIHIHHHPFTLYDIVTIVYQKRLQNGEPLDEELVAKEVMLLHFNLLVGLIPLSETVHELVHNNYLFIPMDRVYGEYDKFKEAYEPYIPIETLDIYERNKEFTEKFNENLEDSNMHILNKNYIYYDLSSQTEVPDYDKLIADMNQRVMEIKSEQESKKSNYQYAENGLINGIYFE